MKRSNVAGRVEEVSGFGSGGGGKEAREAAEKEASLWRRKNIPWLLDWRKDLTQILLPVDGEDKAPSVKWSTVDKDSAVDISADGYTASCLTGESDFRHRKSPSWCDRSASHLI
jgi:hypothetical protein